MNGKTRRNGWDSAAKAFPVLQFYEENPPAIVYTLRDIPIVKRDLFDRKIGERIVKATRQFEISLFRRRKNKNKKEKERRFYSPRKSDDKIHLFFTFFLSFSIFSIFSLFFGNKISRRTHRPTDRVRPQRERSYNGWYFYFDYLLDEGWPPGKIRSRCDRKFARVDRTPWLSSTMIFAVGRTRGERSIASHGGDTRNIARNKKLCLFNESSFLFFLSLLYFSSLFNGEHRRHRFFVDTSAFARFLLLLLSFFCYDALRTCVSLRIRVRGPI